MNFPPATLHALLEQYDLDVVENHFDGASIDDLHAAYCEIDHPAGKTGPSARLAGLPYS